MNMRKLKNSMWFAMDPGTKSQEETDEVQGGESGEGPE
jgi:hypothetical protein